MKQSLPELEFRDVCLLAASQLAKRAKGAKADQAVLRELSERLRNFVSSDYSDENHLEASLGLIRDVVNPRAKDFNSLVKSTSAMAKNLTASRLPKKKLEELFELCLALHSAAESKDELRDVPMSHPDLVTFA